MDQVMETQTHPFQQWLEDAGVSDVRYFPANPSTSAPTELLDEAYRAVVAYKAGRTVPYEDNVDDKHPLDA